MPDPHNSAPERAALDGKDTPGPRPLRRTSSHRPVAVESVLVIRSHRLHGHDPSAATGCPGVNPGVLHPQAMAAVHRAWARTSRQSPRTTTVAHSEIVGSKPDHGRTSTPLAPRERTPHFSASVSCV